MKPLIIYVDDEPHNLAVFEASLPSEWDVKTFSNPLEALNALPNLKPWVIVSDQRMPGTTGVQYLELARKLHPEAIRIIVTGYSQEELVIESVRKAHVFDYIKKPWEPEDLESSLNRAIQLYQSTQEAKKLQEELKTREQQLSVQNVKLQESHEREVQLRAELECWAPPFLLSFIQKEKNNFPLKKDLVGLTFDIVNSNQIHNKTISGKPLRSAVLKAFTEAVFKAGGWQESQSGDSAYAHFGLFETTLPPCESALAAAREFRVALRNISEMYQVGVETGIAIHFLKQNNVELQILQIQTPNQNIIHKSLDTSSSQVDALHRMEKLLHTLEGTNIILSSEVVKGLKSIPKNLVELGEVSLKGSSEVPLSIITSDKVTPKHLEDFKTQIGIKTKLKKAA